MRRDRTLKVCANHFITPWMELKPNAGSEKAFVYKVLADFADEKPKSECLAVKFGTIESNFYLFYTFVSLNVNTFHFQMQNYSKANLKKPKKF